MLNVFSAIILNEVRRRKEKYVLNFNILIILDDVKYR